jgi:hypothetical protein
MASKRGKQRPVALWPERAAHEQALQQFADEFGMWRDMYKISIYRVLDGGKLKFLGSHDAWDTGLEVIRNLYGGGKYTAKLLDGRGRWVAQATFCLAERRISGPA